MVVLAMRMDGYSNSRGRVPLLPWRKKGPC
jgi:hypothetical protein